MNKIAVFTDKNSEICEFFEAERFLIYERRAASWEIAEEKTFAKIVPAAPAQTRAGVEALLPLIDGCGVLAGGTLVGIPFTVFDRAGLHIFEIGAINDETFDGIIDDMSAANASAVAKEEIIKNAKPVETETPGVYFLDLIALQKECPEITSKKAMMDFLNDTPLVELRLICKHIPPWIENSGRYNVCALKDSGGVVEAVITKK